jgi:hypothetical protein
MRTVARERRRAWWPVLLALAALVAAPSARASFAPEGGPIAVGADPYGVVAPDFNGDGSPDLAVVNGTSSTLSVFLRQPGGFAQEAGSPIAVGSGPNIAAVADFNGDGRLDIAVSNYVTSNITILLRQPGGGFAADPSSPAAAGRPGAVAAADFDRNGLVDLAAPNVDSGGVTILLRRPGGGFTTESGPTGTTPTNITAADFDGNGFPDLAVTNRGSGSVTILLRQPGGGFAQEGSGVVVGGQPLGVVASDVNGDGLPDLAVANSGSNSVNVLIRQTGGFAQEAPVPVGAGPVGIAATDANGDGRPDLAVASNTAGSVTVLLRQPTGGYAVDAGSPIALFRAYGLAVADFNADKRPDLAVTSDGGGTVTTLLNTTTTPGSPPVSTAPTPPPPPVAGKSVVVKVVSGTVRIKRPGKGYVLLTDPSNIPIGSLIDVRKGRVALTSTADTGGTKLQTAEFYGGIFQVKQAAPKRKPKTPQALITDLVLRDQISRSQCAPLKRARAAAADKKKGPNGVLGKLWGDGKGRFRTAGKYSSATVRGTIWLTQDQCNGTLTRVRRGVVSVRDFKRKKTLKVKAGRSYLARAVKRR